MASSSANTVTGKVTETGERPNYTPALVSLTTLFFMWGFITSMNDILIPYLKRMFELDRFQSMFVQTAFFGAYFIGSLLYYLISSRWKDPIMKMGYKNGLIIGLFLSALGCITFYPAAELKSYGIFLAALFIVGFGFTLLQIAANPYVAILGKPETASSRLNLSQAFNSLGTTIAPILGGYLVFHYFAYMGEPLLNQQGQEILTDAGRPISANGVQIPYLIFAGIFLLLAVVIKITNLPKFTTEDNIEEGAGALKYRHLVLGMVAIFMYVGGEVAIGSVLINYINELVGYPEMIGKSYLAFYWGGAMIGRFLGAISLSGMQNETRKIIMMVFVALVSYLFIYFAVVMESETPFPLSVTYPFIVFLIINLIGFKIGRSLPERTLLIFAVVNLVLLSVTMMTDGLLAVWTIISIGLFNSIMWSNIFTLAIRGLGKFTSQGSSLLVMAILGGALIPPIQGAVADSLGGYHYSFFIPMICYIYLAYYGWKGYKIKKIID
ncbi:MAG: sugar MFS transporter [Candidatus Cyclobacteriaceae bacterium M3_2C_046]